MMCINTRSSRSLISVIYTLNFNYKMHLRIKIAYPRNRYPKIYDVYPRDLGVFNASDPVHVFAEAYTYVYYQNGRTSVSYKTDHKKGRVALWKKPGRVFENDLF